MFGKHEDVVCLFSVEENCSQRRERLGSWWYYLVELSKCQIASSKRSVEDAFSITHTVFFGRGRLFSRCRSRSLSH